MERAIANIGAVLIAMIAFPVAIVLILTVGALSIVLGLAGFVISEFICILFEA